MVLVVWAWCGHSGGEVHRQSGVRAGLARHFASVWAFTHAEAAAVGPLPTWVRAEEGRVGVGGRWIGG